jgi:hypothetical protein
MYGRGASSLITQVFRMYINKVYVSINYMFKRTSILTARLRQSPYMMTRNPWRWQHLIVIDCPERDNPYTNKLATIMTHHCHDSVHII